MDYVAQLSREVGNRRVQQLMRYYLQHGKPALAAGVCKELAGRTLGERLYRRLDERVLYRDDLLAAVPDDKFWYFDAAESYQIDEPHHLSELPSQFRTKMGTYTRPQPFVCEVNDVDLVGPTANPKTSDGKYIQPAQGVTREKLLQNIILEVASSVTETEGTTTTIETAANFLSLYSTNYSHWVLDFLPRLKAVTEYQKRTGRRPTLVIPADPPGWLLEYLDIFGFGPADRHRMESNRIHVDNFVVPYGSRFNRSLVRWANEQARASVSADSAAVPSKVYVSRDDALCRRVLNEDELMRLLYERGFVRVKLENMSVADQIRLFSNAETVVSPHGAGLANLAWATETSVVELFGVKIVPIFFHISQIMELDYGCLFCETTGEDIVADIDDVAEMTDRVEHASESVTPTETD